MKQLTLAIQENEFDTFLAFVKTLDYVSISEEEVVTVAQQQEVERRLQLLKNGQMRSRDWKEAQKDIFKRS